ncbi:hypothetical protein ACJIZ3_025564 [Penstemon smallii]|uniref:Gag1-like clamp domain-containing protein n=1 Tax=Penstemon smallii TaxID=265156 RepID=A0ABD3TXH7_9LAMI
MDNTGVLSRGHISSTCTLTQLHDTYGGSIKSTEFVNPGLLQWNQSRHTWIGNKKPRSLTTNLSEPNLSWNATYDSLLSNNKPFRKPIPLGEMVDFLVDIWEQEGMYD